jgi:tetratricopeptide (TPR) repeat protein
VTSLRAFRSACCLVLLAAVVVRAAEPAGTARGREALQMCQRTDDAPPAEVDAMLAESLRLAEAAVAADDRDPLAHFAVFCALGGQMERAGIGLAALSRLRRLRREVDRTLELAPDYADALFGKASLLLETPRVLGGDPAEGERLLRRALEVEPDYLGPRLELAEALLARGARAEARAEAERALAIAERKKDAEDVAEARALLAKTEPAGGG